jgi:hypothetical protein
MVVALPLARRSFCPAVAAIAGLVVVTLACFAGAGVGDCVGVRVVACWPKATKTSSMSIANIDTIFFIVVSPIPYLF